MSTHDSSGPEPEGGDAPPPSADGGSPYDKPPPGYEAPYGAPPGGYGGRYGTPPPTNGSPYGSPGAGPVPGMPALGSWPNRIIAQVLDFLMVEIIATLVLVPFVNYSNQNSWVAATWLAYGLYLVYAGLMLSRDGQTLGKKLMKVRVAMLIDGSPPSASAAWTRSATFVLPAVICCGGFWWPIDGLFGVFDKPYRQCIHDKAAKTVVVSTA